MAVWAEKIQVVFQRVEKIPVLVIYVKKKVPVDGVSFTPPALRARRFKLLKDVSFNVS